MTRKLTSSVLECRDVPVAGLRVCDNPRVELRANPVGMGIALAGHDPVTRVGGLLHAPLPTAPDDRAGPGDCPAMFVDAAVVSLLAALRGAGARPDRTRFFAVGGSGLLETDGPMNVGDRNCRRLREVLAEHGIELAGQHLGGHSCRAFTLSIGEGRAEVRLAGGGEVSELCPRSENI